MKMKNQVKIAGVIGTINAIVFVLELDGKEENSVKIKYLKESTETLKEIQSD